VCALLLAAATTAAQDETPAKPEPAPLTVEQLGDGLQRISDPVAGCVLVLQTPAGMLLVDSEDAKNAEPFDALLFTLGKSRVNTIVNSHYHYDHIGGNGRHRQGARIIAHANMWAQAVKDTTIPEWNNWHREAAPADAKPTETFSDSMSVHLAGTPVILWHVPAAHTDGDVMTWFPTYNVLHTGDIVEVGAAPFIDWWAGGSLTGMIAGCDRILQMADDDTKIVPGHGDVVDRAYVRDYRNMLADIGKRAEAAVQDSVSMKDFLETDPAEAYAEKVGGARSARRLAALIYFGASGMKTD
jgi:glyoxylase-like metal-dependent hydrolase (beta-lactamase superfamily II)